MASERDRVAGRWTQPGRGAVYRRHGSGQRGRGGRGDGPIVAKLLALGTQPGALVLDAPAGSGRLVDWIARDGRRWVGADVSPTMLAALPAAHVHRAVRARLEHLPFLDRSADAVVCCRLLHHLSHASDRVAVLRECARVARDAVVVSFWDRACLAQWRRRWRGRDREPGAGGGAHERHALSRAQVAADLRAAGLEPLRFWARARFVSAQTFVLARPGRVEP